LIFKISLQDFTSSDEAFVLGDPNSSSNLGSDLRPNPSDLGTFEGESQHFWLKNGTTFETSSDDTNR